MYDCLTHASWVVFVLAVAVILATTRAGEYAVVVLVPVSWFFGACAVIAAVARCLF